MDKDISKWGKPMNVINRRVSRLEVSLIGNERRDERERTAVDAILEARRRRRAEEGLPPEENLPPASPFRTDRRPQSAAEAILAARAALMARDELIRP